MFENLDDLLGKIGDSYVDESVSIKMKRALLNLEITLLQIKTIHLEELAKE